MAMAVSMVVVVSVGLSANRARATEAKTQVPMRARVGVVVHEAAVTMGRGVAGSHAEPTVIGGALAGGGSDLTTCSTLASRGRGLGSWLMWKRSTGTGGRSCTTRLAELIANDDVRGSLVG